MNRVFLLLVGLLLVGAGCSRVDKQPIKVSEYPGTSPKKVVVDEQQEMEKKILAANERAKERLKGVENNFFKNHFVPSSTLTYGESFSGNNPVSDYNIVVPISRDCVSVYSENTSGGDVLSSLSGDDNFRTALSLDTFSKKYSVELKQKLNAYTESQYQKDLFVFYVCHIQEDTDIIAGNLWSNTISPYFVDNGMINISNDFSKDSILALSTVDGIHELKNIQKFGANATGGETEPCSVELNKDGTFIWKCFAGLVEDPATHMTHGAFKNWTLSLDGNIIKTWDTRD